MNTLLNFYTFVREINKANGRNYKLDILRKYSNDQDIAFYLEYIYNPYKVTGISTKKLSKKFLDTDIFYAKDFQTVKDLLTYILENNTGSDAILKIIKKFMLTHLSKYEEEEALENLLENIISKDLNIGVAVLSINKIFKDLIPTFNVMLANKYFDNPTIVEGKEFALTTKIDGGRIIAIKKNGVAKFYTRQGQEYEGLVDLKYELESIEVDNICLDGEITLLDPYVTNYVFEDVNNLWEDTPSKAVTKKLSSKEQYKATMKITSKDGEKHGVKMLVFDIMTADEFEKQVCDTPYWKRRIELSELFEQSGVTFKYFELLPLLYRGTDTNQITKWLNYNIEHDEEGVMINMSDAPYEFKRTNNLLKVKKMQDLDLEVIGYEEGSGLFAGMLGNFIVRYKDGNVVKVGSGLEKEFRQKVWQDPDSYIGKIITVQYFEETRNQQGGISLRFPVFIGIRTDKSVADF